MKLYHYRVVLANSRMLYSHVFASQRPNSGLYRWTAPRLELCIESTQLLVIEGVNLDGTLVGSSGSSPSHLKSEVVNQTRWSLEVPTNFDTLVIFLFAQLSSLTGRSNLCSNA